LPNRGFAASLRNLRLLLYQEPAAYQTEVVQ
jgi:hypothetical protein